MAPFFTNTPHDAATVMPTCGTHAVTIPVPVLTDDVVLAEDVDVVVPVDVAMLPVDVAALPVDVAMLPVDPVALDDAPPAACVPPQPWR